MKVIYLSSVSAMDSVFVRAHMCSSDGAEIVNVEKMSKGSHYSAKLDVLHKFLKENPLKETDIFTCFTDDFDFRYDWKNIVSSGGFTTVKYKKKWKELWPLISVPQIMPDIRDKGVLSEVEKDELHIYITEITQEE